jgi:class 3 adenylate cyclase
MHSDAIGIMIELSAPAATTLRVVVTQPLVIGREGTGLRIPDAKVSRRHIEVRPDDDGLMVTDLGSTNGTYLNGTRMTGQGRVGHADSLRLGRTVLRCLGAVALVEPPEGGDERGTEKSGLDTMTTIDSLAREAAGDQDSLREMLRRGGTITVMFSDIADSTVLATEMGDEAWFAVLQAHEGLVRGAVADADGRVVKAQGDGFMASFTSASAAVVCAIRIQQAIATGDDALRVRIGLHTGDAIELDDGDWIGRHVITASRIADSADGGEIHSSDLVYELTRSLPDMPFGPPIEAELKGLGPVVMRPVLWENYAG